MDGIKCLENRQQKLGGLLVLKVQTKDAESFRWVMYLDGLDQM